MAQHERDHERAELVPQHPEREVAPVDVWRLAHRRQQQAHPYVASYNRKDRPGIIDESPYEDGYKIQAERPFTKESSEGVETAGRDEGDERAHGERHRGASGRIAQMEEAAELFFQGGVGAPPNRCSYPLAVTGPTAPSTPTSRSP